MLLCSLTSIHALEFEITITCGFGVVVKVVVHLRNVMHFLIRVKAPLGGTTRIEPPQGMLRNQNWPNNILGPFLLNLFIVIKKKFLMFIH